MTDREGAEAGNEAGHSAGTSGRQDIRTAVDYPIHEAFDGETKGRRAERPSVVVEEVTADVSKDERRDW